MLQQLKYLVDFDSKSKDLDNNERRSFIKSNKESVWIGCNGVAAIQSVQTTTTTTTKIDQIRSVYD